MSKLKRMTVKPVAVILSVLMILLSLPLSAFSFEAGDTTQLFEGVESDIYEVNELREESVKHFRLEDGSYVAIQYPEPVHIQNEKGEWEDIDNTLSSKGSEFSTSNARIKFSKKITGNNALFTLHDGNRKITMSLDGAIKKTKGTITNTKTEFDDSATKLQKMTALDQLSSQIKYENILNGVDIEYIVHALNVKENIIIKEKSESYSYSFTIALNNLEAVLEEDGAVRIFDPDTKETVYCIPAGYMYDADNAYSGAVTYHLDSIGNGKYSLTVIADADWINAEERVFPVCVDPTINM